MVTKCLSTPASPPIYWSVILLSIKPVRNQKYSNIQIVMCVSLSHQTFNGHYELSHQSKELYKFLSARQIKSYTQTLKKGAEFSGIKTKVYATEINSLFNPSKKSNILFKRTMRSLILWTMTRCHLMKSSSKKIKKK